MLNKGGDKMKSYPGALIKDGLILGFRGASLVGLLILAAGCMAWGQSQKEFIYL
jgi:hypothetical protein